MYDGTAHISNMEKDDDIEDLKIPCGGELHPEKDD